MLRVSALFVKTISISIATQDLDINVTADNLIAKSRAETLMIMALLASLFLVVSIQSNVNACQTIQP
jgi:hypothetical protein